MTILDPLNNSVFSPGINTRTYKTDATSIAVPLAVAMDSFAFGNENIIELDEKISNYSISVKCYNDGKDNVYYPWKAVIAFNIYENEIYKIKYQPTDYSTVEVRIISLNSTVRPPPEILDFLAGSSEVNGTEIPIEELLGNDIVVQYLVTSDPALPSSTDDGWSTTPPTSITL